MAEQVGGNERPLGFSIQRWGGPADTRKGKGSVLEPKASFSRVCISLLLGLLFDTKLFHDTKPTLKRWAIVRCPSGTRDILAERL